MEETYRNRGFRSKTKKPVARIRNDYRQIYSNKLFIFASRIDIGLTLMLSFFTHLFVFSFFWYFRYIDASFMHRPISRLVDTSYSYTDDFSSAAKIFSHLNTRWLMNTRRNNYSLIKWWDNKAVQDAAYEKMSHNDKMLFDQYNYEISNPQIADIAIKFYIAPATWVLHNQYTGNEILWCR